MRSPGHAFNVELHQTLCGKADHLAQHMLAQGRALAVPKGVVPMRSFWNGVFLSFRRYSASHYLCGRWWRPSSEKTANWSIGVGRSLARRKHVALSPHVPPG
jgi:hypothetical protein